MSLLNKTKDNTIFLDTFICLKNCVWTFHFFLKAYALQKKLDYCGRPKTTAKDQKTTAKGPLAYCGGSAR